MLASGMIAFNKTVTSIGGRSGCESFWQVGCVNWNLGPKMPHT